MDIFVDIIFAHGHSFEVIVCTKQIWRNNIGYLKVTFKT
jgi:hypothetical protein